MLPRAMGLLLLLLWQSLWQLLWSATVIDGRGRGEGVPS
jgi:hypothetical protein